MLLQFKCENHRSIKDEVVFSMVATSDTTHANSLINFNDNKYLRCAEIYGANGSGKTSLLDGIAKMTAIILNSNNHQPGDLIIRAPHKLSNKEEPTKFSIIFEKSGIKYSYGFSYTENGIHKEFLFYWPGQKKAKIFERVNNDFSFGDSFSRQGENCRGRLKINQLLLSVGAKETDIKEISDVFLFFKNDLIVYPGEPNNWFDFSIEKLQNDKEMKQKFINFMHLIDSDLVDVYPKFERRILTEKELPPGLPQFLIAQILNTPSSVIDLKLDYGKFIIDINEESKGTQKLFRFLCPIIDILSSGKIFICDEIETHLHPSIVQKIVNEFLLNTSQKSQIVFTTHDTDLLDLDMIRRDQIWFTELKPESRSTDLYSLAELKNVRKDENIRKGYISGKYGAIPIVGSIDKRFFKE